MAERNEQAFADAHPDGAKYMGTFFAVRTSEKKADNVYTLVKMDSYGTQDAMAGAGREYHRLLNEAISFFDQSNHPNYSSVLLKSATEATLYGD